MADEILDIVDPNDNVIGQKPRSEIYEQGLSCFRVVNAFLENPYGELWIPRRSADKKLFPLCLDVSMGGHVISGESYETALKRELSEELGPEVAGMDYHLMGKLMPHHHGVSAFMKVYKIYTDHTPAYNRNDFVEYFWLAPQELLDRIRNGDRAKDDLPRLIKMFYV